MGDNDMTMLSGIKGKLGLLFMASLLILSASALLTTSRLNTNVDQYERVVTGVMQAEVVALQANLNFKTQVQEWKNVLIRGSDPAQMDKYWTQFETSHNATQASIKALLPLISPYPDLRKIAQQFLADHTAMKKAYSSGRTQFISAKFDLAVGDKAVSGIDRAPSAALDKLINQLDIRVKAQAGIAAGSAAANVQFSYILTVLILLVASIVIFSLIDRIICRPLSSVQANLADLAKGDLSITCTTVSKDEVGQIADSTRELQTFLRANVDSMKQTSLALIEAADHLENTSASLSRQTGDQVAATEQVATAVQEMTHSASEVASNSESTSSITEETLGKAGDGTKKAQLAQERAVSLVSDLNTGAAVIKTLAENAANVSNVLDVIRGIAEQTNLLALNAAIEAARAGDQGRGFAVVADEVRTLAQRTQDSTAEIENILESVTSGADKAVVAMDSGQLRSKEVENDITAAALVLTDIAQIMGEINGKSVQIATAANEQTAVADGISTLIQNIHQLSEATQGQVDETQQLADTLKTLVQQFDRQITHFVL
jgi:methyl-accepting chemotaxis protein